MQYVLINDGYVLNGPREWNYRSFESTLSDDLDIPVNLPMQKNDNEPIIINESTRIIPSTMVYPDYNPKIEYLDGPYWTFEEDMSFATGNFQVKDQPIEYVKQTLIGRVAANRYIKESAGTTTVIQDKTVTVDTSREGRAIFVQAYTLMADDATINWKFPEAWLTLTKNELGTIIATGANHIQTQFDWENTISQQIDNASSVEELQNITIVEKNNGAI